MNHFITELEGRWKLQVIFLQSIHQRFTIDNIEWLRYTVQHRGNTLFCRAVTFISSQRLPHKMTNSRQFW